MQQDELARIFSASMNLSQSEQEEGPKQIVYASQHYTHSHHVAPRSASEPALGTQINESDLAAVLIRNSIDPSLLFPSQITLFQNADDDQRLRLLELWRISPPTGRQGYPSGTDYNMSRQLYDWPPTSLAQEEAMAKLRYERQQADCAQQHAKQQQQLEHNMGAASAEPYMSSGYEMMARREYEESARVEKALPERNKYNQATDAVYKHVGSNGLWPGSGSLSDMENNYGAYTYAREYGLQAGCGDQEMVM